MHRSDIGKLVDSTLGTVGGTHTDQVVVVTTIPVELYVESVVQEAEVNTNVELMFLFIGQIGVSEVVNVKSRLLIACEWTPGVELLNDSL